MARIPDAELKRLKEETDLVALVRKPAGKDLRGRCPFHKDATPSLVVTPAKHLWHCFGACATGGSAIDWVMKAHALSFRHAVEVLRAGLPAAAATPGVKHSTVRRLPAPVALDADDQRLLNQVIEFYQETLKRTPEALAYLDRRGLRSAEMLERFKLGYANRTLGYRLPEKSRKTGAEIRGRLTALGILRASGHEHFA